MTAPSAHRAPTTAVLVAAFLVIYVVWGSTFLAVRFAVASMPPFLTAASRNVAAGLVLVGLGLMSGAGRPTVRALRQAVVVGGLMFLVNQGGIAWASQRNPSGITALLAATVPIWIVALEWIWGGGGRPTLRTGAGVVLGFLGSLLLLWPVAGAPVVDPTAAGVTTCAAVAWAAGTLRARRMRLSDAPMMSTGLPMLLGGLLLVALSAVTGEWAAFRPAEVTLRAALALLYLIVMGSLLAFSAYLWLLRTVPATRVATYAYVNPVVALIAGAWLGGEIVGASTLVAAAVSLAGVYLVVSD